MIWSEIELGISFTFIFDESVTMDSFTEMEILTFLGWVGGWQAQQLLYIETAGSTFKTASEKKINGLLELCSGWNWIRRIWHLLRMPKSVAGPGNLSTMKWCSGCDELIRFKTRISFTLCSQKRNSSPFPRVLHIIITNHSSRSHDDQQPAQQVSTLFTRLRECC